MYFIEDVWPFHIMSEKEWKHPWLQKHPDRYNKAEMEYFMEQIPFSTKCVEFDLREASGQPDSYILKIDK